MEVHAHTHTPRKKWTHYFWEFLMLFLAVFCGFLAENQREHYIENQRAKQFAASLYHDLKNDTTDLNRIIQWGGSKINHIDSLLDMLKNESHGNDTSFSIHSAWMVFVNKFFPNRGTFDQLKSSGSLRYFKQEFVTLLLKYENIMDETKLREEAEFMKLEQRIIPFVQEKINYEFVYAILRNLPLPQRVYVNLKEQKTIDIMINEAIEIKIVGLRRKELYQQLKGLATEILNSLKIKYNLE
jgi:hypothetical protein